MTYTNFIWTLIGWSALAGVVFAVLLRIRAPYGRYGDQRSGPTISNRLGWILMELPALVTLPLFVTSGPSSPSAAVWVAVTLWEIHYVNRTIVFPFRQRTSGKRMPVAVVASGAFFNIVNGALIGYHLAHFGGYLNDTWFSDPRFYSGLALFAIGLLINWRADQVLLHLRKPGETDYKIPGGLLFRKISCPNYAGEIVEWLGFALLTWSPAAFTFVLWTLANLVPRALSHHEWYRSRFPDYPSERKAIVPWVV